VLLPFFGKMRMDKITQDDVERFLKALISQKLQNTTINSYYGTLKTMMIEAVERKVIDKNPTEKVEKLADNCKEIRIITPDEFKKLFLGDWQEVWENDRISFTANKLAALTGMRSSEVLGLRGEFVYEGYIFLCKQYDKFGYRDTKTKNKHNIPLPASMVADLNKLKQVNGDGFLFSENGGEKPVERKNLYRNFHRALVNIGISKKEIAERKLHLHGWRHFCNTEMLKGGLSIPQAQAITGHLSKKMTERYNHFDPAEFVKAKEVQDALLKPRETA
jgi:integrase